MKTERVGKLAGAVVGCCIGVSIALSGPIDSDGGPIPQGMHTLYAIASIVDDWPILLGGPVLGCIIGHWTAKWVRRTRGNAK